MPRFIVVEAPGQFSFVLRIALPPEDDQECSEMGRKPFLRGDPSQKTELKISLKPDKSAYVPYLTPHPYGLVVVWTGVSPFMIRSK